MTPKGHTTIGATLRMDRATDMNALFTMEQIADQEAILTTARGLVG